MNVHTSAKKVKWLGLAIMAMTLAGGTLSSARLIGDVPTAQLVFPALAHNSQIRLAGTVTRGPVNRDFPLEEVSIRLRLMEEEGISQDFMVPITLDPNKHRPNEASFLVVIAIRQTGFFAPGKVGSGAVITELEELVGRGRRKPTLNWAAYIEQDNFDPSDESIVAPYVVQLLDKGFD